MEEQVIPGMKEGRGLAANRRMGWFMTVVFVLLLCAAGSFAWFNINMAENTFRQDVEHSLANTAQSKATEISLWFNSIQGQADRLTQADLFRLFASEVDSLGDNPAARLRLAEKESADAELSQLASQLPLMENLLREFSSLSGFLQARISNGQAQTYLSSEVIPSPLSAEQKNAIQQTVSSGKIVVLPVRKATQGLVLDMAFPLLAPSYVENKNVTVAALFISVGISPRLGELVANRPNAYGVTRVLQVTNGTLEELLPTGETRKALRWSGNEAELEAFGEWNLFDTGPVFHVGVKEADLPWIVSQEMPVSVARQDFLEKRTVIIGWTVAFIVVVSLGLLALWWWLVGRNARSISTEILHLYKLVTRQKQLLDNINATLVDGIVLTDKGGVVRYANQAFSRMVGRSDEELIGMDCSAIFGYDTALRLYRQLDAASSRETDAMFKETIWLQSKKYYFQITCSPYRNEMGNITGVVSVFRDISQLIEAQERNQRMVQQTIAAFMQAIEAVDPYLGGHSLVMANLGSEISKEMGLDEKDEITIRTAASLSQIGKLRLPKDLLNKPGAFTPEERHLMERHVEYARDTLKNISFEFPIVNTVYQMNEFMDGSGYPERLQGDAIGMPARVLAVANTFCALIRPRAYRNAKSVEEALHILEENSAKYDPQVLKALREYLNHPAGERFIAGLGEKR